MSFNYYLDCEIYQEQYEEYLAFKEAAENAGD